MTIEVSETNIVLFIAWSNGLVQGCNCTLCRRRQQNSRRKAKGTKRIPQKKCEISSLFFCIGGLL